MWDKLFSDSFEKCIPIASDSESVNAIVNIPPITMNLDCVDANNPTIRPRVVTMPDGRPKLNPTLNAFLMITQPTNVIYILIYIIILLH